MLKCESWVTNLRGKEENGTPAQIHSPSLSSQLEQVSKGILNTVAIYHTLFYCMRASERRKASVAPSLR